MPKGLRPITTYNVYQGAKTVAANTSETSVAFDLREVAQDGLFSIEYTITGTGTAAITYTVCSTATGTFFTPTGGGTIKTGLTSGHGGLAFEPEMYPFMKIVTEETGDSNAVVVTLQLNIQ